MEVPASKRRKRQVTLSTFFKSSEKTADTVTTLSDEEHLVEGSTLEVDVGADTDCGGLGASSSSADAVNIGASSSSADAVNIGASSSSADAVNIGASSSFTDGSSSSHVFSHDIGELFENLDAHINDDQIYSYLKDHVRPPAKMFSKTIIKGGKPVTLTYQASWMSGSRAFWHVYSPKLNGGLCRVCLLFDKSDDSSKRGAFVKFPFQRLEKALSSSRKNPGAINSHEQSAYHIHALQMAEDFLYNYEHPQSKIEGKIDKTKQENLVKNKYILRSIIDAILLCGKQGIALRGHRDDSTADPSSNRGNFLSILEAFADRDPILKQHLENCPKNARYTSKTIQNDIIDCSKQHIQENILHVMDAEGASPFFSVIGDEVTCRVSNKEIFSLCFRYLDLISNEKPVLKEAFFELADAPRTTGKALGETVLHILENHNRDLTLCVGQCYDGAASMSSSRVGCQAEVKAKAGLAFYQHCFSHCLNLVISQSTQIPEIKNMIDAINQTFYFFHNSPKRQCFFQKLLAAEFPLQKNQKVKGLSKTRWVERHKCYESYFEMYTCIALTFEAILDPAAYESVYATDDEYTDNDWDWDTETRIKAQGLLRTMQTPVHAVSLTTVMSALEPIKPLTIKLQKRNQDIYQAYKQVDETIDFSVLILILYLTSGMNKHVVY